MIIWQPDIDVAPARINWYAKELDTRPVKLDWYFSEHKLSRYLGDTKYHTSEVLREVHPMHVVTRYAAYYAWDSREW